MRLFCLFYSLYPSTFSCFFFLFSSPYFLCSKKKSYLSWVLVDCSRTANSIYLSLIVSLSHRFLSFFASPLLVRALLLFYYLFLVSYYFKEKEPYFLHQTNKKKTLRVLVTSTPRAKVLYASSVVFFVAAALSFCEKTKNIHLFPTIKKKKKKRLCRIAVTLYLHFFFPVLVLSYSAFAKKEQDTH